MNFLNTLSEAVKGAFFMFAGLILLLHTLGILQQGLNYILIAISLYLMVLGFMKIGGVEKFKALTKKKAKSVEKPN